MNFFFYDFTRKLQQVSTETELRALYRWIYTKQTEVSDTAVQINQLLKLDGAFALQPDLPCISVGSTKGFVVLAANPGWICEINMLEDSYCRQSSDAYENFIFNFFNAYPSVTGGYSKWWNNALSKAAKILFNGDTLLSGSGPARWASAYRNKCVGGWELFPWHSSKDGISTSIDKHDWLHDFANASINTLFRLNPEAIFVASKTGYELIRFGLMKDLNWKDARLGNKKGAAISYAKLESGTEVIAIGIQLFANVHRDFKDEEMYSTLRTLRS
jgi:hypothetical protein